MSRRILIISPHFPPINAPDHQRVRMSLPYLKTFGWDAHVLAVKSDHVEGGTYDHLLTKTLPQEIPVTYVDAVPIKYTRPLGLGNLGIRSLPYLKWAGDRLLKKEHFDLVYFSTTMFPAMALGQHWYQRHNIPYILDFQDPWLSDYYKQPDAPPPPGGKFKYGISQLQAKLLEPKAVRSASHLISVSPAYPQTLQQRYPFLSPEQFSVLPFGAPEADFQSLPSLQVNQTIFDPNDGNRHWVYVGRGGHDMSLALRSLFLSIHDHRQAHPQQWQSIRLHFVGTSYAPKSLAIKTVEPIAQECGVADLVEEHTSRVPYFEALKILVDSDAIIIPGSDDPSYTASKLYPCILAKKPILAIFHKQSSVVKILRQCRAGVAVTFASQSSPHELINPIQLQLNSLIKHPKEYQPDTDWAVFEPYTASTMTRKQCEIFDASVS